MTTRTGDAAGVCVVGNLNIDLLLRGVDGLPEWGQEIVGTSHHYFPAGQAGYLALGIAALQTSVSVIGVVGDDDSGADIIRALESSGANADGVELLEGEQTGLTVALVRPDGERAFASNIGCSGRLTAELLEHTAQHRASSSFVALVGLFMVANLPIPAARAFLAQCRSEGRTTVLDTGWDPAGWRPESLGRVRDLLGVVDLFLPNLDEARAITGQDRPEHALSALTDLCPGTVVIKCGSGGSLAWHEGRVLRHDAIPATVVDTVGAGDVFNAGLLSALVDGAPIDDALQRAHAGASIYVSRSTDRYPSRSDVNAVMAGSTDNHEKTGASNDSD